MSSKSVSRRFGGTDTEAPTENRGCGSDRHSGSASSAGQHQPSNGSIGVGGPPCGPGGPPCGRLVYPEEAMGLSGLRFNGDRVDRLWRPMAVAMAARQSLVYPGLKVTMIIKWRQCLAHDKICSMSAISNANLTWASILHTVQIRPRYQVQ